MSQQHLRPNPVALERAGFGPRRIWLDDYPIAASALKVTGVTIDFAQRSVGWDLDLALAGAENRLRLRRHYGFEGYGLNREGM